MQTLEEIDHVCQRIKTARRVLFITGAGISADSGLPTYRGIGGLYNDQATEDGLPIEVALSGEVLRQRPEITWKYLAQIESSCRHARPNLAHEIIARLQTRVATTVLTQNIDGFHREAGSEDLIEIHGNLFDLHCPRCGHTGHVSDYSTLSTLPPPCPQCASNLRPTVVLFGESLPGAAIRRLETIMDEGYEVVLSVGTTSVFPYIAQPFMMARQFDALAIEINPGTTCVSASADVAWRCGAASALQQLWEHLA